MSPEARKTIVNLITEYSKNGLSVKKSCKVLDISDSTFYEWKHNPDQVDKRIKGNFDPKQRKVTNPQTEMALNISERQEIVKQLKDPKYAHLSIRQLHQTMLNERGKYLASVSSYYRIAREEGLINHAAKKRVNRFPQDKIDFERRKSCCATEPNQVWMWDISYFSYRNDKSFVYLFAAVDLYSRKIVAAKFYRDQCADSAVEFFKTAFTNNGISPLNNLVIHSDNGAAMRSELTVNLFKQYGAQLSLSRPSVSNDNPFIESLFRSLKYPYNLDVSSLDKLEQCNVRLDRIVQSYNNDLPHSSLNFVPPAVRHAVKEDEKRYLAKCRQAHEEHFKQHPERYIAGKMRAYEPEGAQYLNPSAEMVINDHKEMSPSKSLKTWAKRLEKNHVIESQDGGFVLPERDNSESKANGGSR